MATMLIQQGKDQTLRTNLLCQPRFTATQLNTNQAQLRMATSIGSEATVEKDCTLSNKLIRSLALVWQVVVAMYRIKEIIGWVNKQTYRLLSKMQVLLSGISLRQVLAQEDKDQAVETAMINLRKYRAISLRDQQQQTRSVKADHHLCTIEDKNTQITVMQVITRIETKFRIIMSDPIKT